MQIFLLFCFQDRKMNKLKPNGDNFMQEQLQLFDIAREWTPILAIDCFQ